MKRKSSGWWKLLIPAISMLFSGIIYAWSVLKVPLGEEFGWSSSALAFNFTLTLCFFCIGGIIGGRFVKRSAVKPGLWLAAALVTAGFVLTSRLSGNISALYLSYAAFAGTGIGVAYNIIISTCNAWFPGQKGICSGILMMCFGLSSLLLGKVADLLFSLPSVGWRKTFLLLGLGSGIVLVLCGVWLQWISKRATGSGAPVSASQSFCLAEFSSKEMVQRPSFWKFFFSVTLLSASGSAVISFARDLALTAGAEASLATTLVGVLSLCNGSGRIISGLISDTLGVRKAMLISNTVGILAPIALLLAVNQGSCGICVVGLCLTGVTYGFLATIISAFISSFYGLKNFASNYSIANLMIFPSSLGATIASILLVKTGGYSAPLALLALFAILAMAANVSIKKP